MATFAGKSVAQLEEEIRQLEENASRQQLSATSYEQALQQSQNRLAEAERNRSLQEAHLRQLESDIKLKSDSAHDAREAAASRKQELRQRLEKVAQVEARRMERRQALLQLDDFEIDALAAKARQDSAVMASFQRLQSERWRTDDLRNAQAMLWEVLSGGSSRHTIDTVNRVMATLDAEEDEVMVISVKPRDRTKIQSRNRRLHDSSPGPLTPVSKFSNTDISDSDQVNMVYQRRTKHGSPSVLDQPRLNSEPASASAHSRRGSSSLSASRLTSSPARTSASSPQWNLVPPSRTKRPRITSGADFFNLALDDDTMNGHRKVDSSGPSK